jgi:hypothetical protein
LDKIPRQKGLMHDYSLFCKGKTAFTLSSKDDMSAVSGSTSVCTPTCAIGTGERIVVYIVRHIHRRQQQKLTLE